MSRSPADTGAQGDDTWREVSRGEALGQVACVPGLAPVRLWLGIPGPHPWLGENSREPLATAGSGLPWDPAKAEWGAVIPSPEAGPGGWAGNDVSAEMSWALGNKSGHQTASGRCVL